MKMPWAFALTLWCASASVAAEKGSPLPRSDPEPQGIASSAILDFVKAANKDTDALHSLMIVRHGQVVAEGWWAPYTPESPHSLYSLSKSFTSTAVGLAIAEGKLGLDDEVLKFFPEDAPEKPGDNLKAMRVRDLLRMSTGHQSEPKLTPTSDERWTKTFLAHPVPNKPGTHFVYNTPATYMLSAIVQKATGTTVLDFLKPRLFEPLGIENPSWGTSPQGVSLGGYGLSVRTEDIAKFGQLYLQKGQWNGKTVVPEAWVNEATKLQTSTGSNPTSDWEQGYGYQFWRCRRHAFRGDGAFGQYCIVFPEEDAVIAITSGTWDMQRILNLVWEKLLPAFKSSPLAAADDALGSLKTTLTGLAIRTPQTSSTPASISHKTYRFPDNDRKLEAVTLESDAKGEAVTLVTRIGGVDKRIPCGQGVWAKGRVAFGPLGEQPAAVSCAWVGDDTFTAKVCFYETPFTVTLNLKFKGDELLFDSDSNVEFGDIKKTPQLVGKAE